MDIITLDLSNRHIVQRVMFIKLMLGSVYGVVRCDRNRVIWNVMSTNLNKLLLLIKLLTLVKLGLQILNLLHLNPSVWN